MTGRRPYPSDISDARWALIEPILGALPCQGGLRASSGVAWCRLASSAVDRLSSAVVSLWLLPGDVPTSRRLRRLIPDARAKPMRVALRALIARGLLHAPHP